MFGPSSTCGHRRARTLGLTVGRVAVIPTLACAFSLIVSPLMIFATSGDFQALDARPENRIFWPSLLAISIFSALRARFPERRGAWPPHIVCLLVYLGFAGASVLWAFSPERSLVRFTQQAMIVSSLVLPVMAAPGRVDLMGVLYLCFTASLLLNLGFVLDGSVTLARYTSGIVDIGYQGYFIGKNYLGQCAAVALLLALSELRFSGWRRACGFVVSIMAVWLVVLSDSKTALGLALVCPLLARLMIAGRGIARVSLAVLLGLAPLLYTAVSSVSNFNMNRIAYILYGDSSLTGRTVIWDFAQYEMARRPLLGWGYQSFWLVPNSPAVSDAPGWVKMMPNAHNGYYDTELELGYVGLALLLIFIFTTVHAIGRVADRDPARARLMLSLALFVICYNYFESLWMRGFEFLWVVIIIVACDIAQYWRPVLQHKVTFKRPGSGRPPSVLRMTKPTLPSR